MKKLDGKKIGVAITGSFCTFEDVLGCISDLVVNGAEVTAILSYAASDMDTKFGKAENFKREIMKITRREIIDTIPRTEPIGPGKMLDGLIVLPCTGNTLAKIAAGIADTPATFSVKSHLRNGRPVVIGISSNDALAAGAQNIGKLLNVRNMYFVPFGQDDAVNKPRSVVFHKECVLEAMTHALDGVQVQPILV